MKDLYKFAIVNESVRDKYILTYKSDKKFQNGEMWIITKINKKDIFSSTLHVEYVFQVIVYCKYK